MTTTPLMVGSMRYSTKKGAEEMRRTLEGLLDYLGGEEKR